MKIIMGWLVLVFGLALTQAQTNGIYTVTNYGVVGDGTNDDYPGLLAAYQALHANNGGELYFPPNLTCRIATAGATGLLISNQSNVSIVMASNTVLVMDNLVGGLAVSHGIFVQGPATNITMTGVHVRYASMAVARQGWAPIYFLGANVGNGYTWVNGNVWMRGSPTGAEDPAGIDAGAIKNVQLENVTVENSPSGMICIVGVDGITITNFTGINSWADGLYHLYFKNSLISGARLINCGDDGISMASYESDTNDSDIANSYHGEDSVITNVVISGYWPTNGGYVVPSGGLAFLGVRNVTVNDVAINNHYRGIRIETGFDDYLNSPSFNFNFLACQNLSIAGVDITNCTEMLCFANASVTLKNDPKWWLAGVGMTNVNAHGGNITVDVYGVNPGDYGLMAGYNITGFNASGYAQPYGTFQNFVDCTFSNMQFDGQINFNGFVPYEGDPGATNGLDGGRYPIQNSQVLDVQCQSVTFEGLRGCYLDGIVSRQAPQDGITVTSCGAVVFGTLSVTNANRTDWEWASGISIDSYCKNIIGSLLSVTQDNQPLPTAINLSSVTGNSIAEATVVTDLNTPYDLVWDQLDASTGVSQFGSISWYDAGYTGGTPEWQTISFQ